MIKRLLACILLLTAFSTSFAGNVNKIVFFGDSLSDNGKLYDLLFHILPKSPPYFDGRFSNGPTWAENVAKYYYDQSYMASKNFALGGATACFHFPNSKFISTTTLDIEVAAYLLDTIFQNRSHTLFVIWIGANDYLYSSDTDLEKDVNKVVGKIDWAIRDLTYYGGNNFLLINMPDLARTPFAKTNNAETRLHTLSMLHNLQLQAALDKYHAQYPNTHLYTVDAYTRMNNLLNDPEFYNKKYNINITDTTTSCWTGGFTLKQLQGQTLVNEITQDAIKMNGSLPPNFDAEIISRYLAGSPELAYTYALGKSLEYGNVPCSDPNQHVFWDDIHPTAVIHEVFASIIEEALGGMV